ncbi:hypothetical protein PSU4_19990 [Pseudonocardia sulfidoxydans NBRC 16205]|uniref:Uncharacterized protein n=1 Tax=Pseudonocardia sulfidoxydans NBRC 16205 TaxID=1223511 RepID=A0A511DE33_9PSEU|nr:hypothetical protein [Pseudonocardia sulfidoxydans]GEL23045.1 hypothetical protein PSU4_19990 [Pseudonocardia sulfidoxydans NBRC 16205]
MTHPHHPSDPTTLRRPDAPDPTKTGRRVTATTVRLGGLALASGAVAWAVGLLLVGDQVQHGIQTLDTITGAAYVAGLACLMYLLAGVGAGGRRVGRILPQATIPVLLGALLLNLLSLGYARYEDLPTALQILDICWPLGQLMVLAVGVTVAVVGRLRGLLRWQPLLCGLWFPVSTVAQLLLDPEDSVVVSAVWLLVSAAALGIRLAVRPADLSTSAGTRKASVRSQ